MTVYDLCSYCIDEFMGIRICRYQDDIGEDEILFRGTFRETMESDFSDKEVEFFSIEHSFLNSFFIIYIK